VAEIHDFHELLKAHDLLYLSFLILFLFLTLDSKSANPLNDLIHLPDDGQSLYNLYPFDDPLKSFLNVLNAALCLCRRLLIDLWLL
jgi:hypothetical protein